MTGHSRASSIEARRPMWETATSAGTVCLCEARQAKHSPEGKSTPEYRPERDCQGEQRSGEEDGHSTTRPAIARQSPAIPFQPLGQARNRRQASDTDRSWSHTPAGQTDPTPLLYKKGGLRIRKIGQHHSTTNGIDPDSRRTRDGPGTRSCGTRGPVPGGV